MGRFNVLIDTNIFMAAKYNFSGGSLCNLKKYCEDGIAVLFTNDIILREVASHIDEDVGLMARQAKNAIGQRAELVNAITQEVYQSIKDTILGATKGLHSQFEAYMAGATNLSNGGLTIDVLFDQYFGKCAPFEGNEKKKWEFPDAAVIMSIKRYIAENPGVQLHVITDDNGWHNALKETEGVFLYKNLKELLAKIAEDEQELFTKILQYMETCVEELRRPTEDWVVCHDWSAIVDNIEMCVECDELEDIYVTSIDLAPDSIEYIDRDGEFASALFSGTVTFLLGFDYIDHTSETYDKEDNIYYNTIYGKGAAEVEMRFAGATTVLTPCGGEMELNSDTFDEITIESIEVIDYKLTPYRNDDAPYFSVCPDCGQPIGINNDGGNGFCSDCAANH